MVDRNTIRDLERHVLPDRHVLVNIAEINSDADVTVGRERATPTDDERVARVRRRAPQGYRIVSL